MQRVLRLGCLTLLVVGLCPGPAEAGLWDWLEELSGPGPFRAKDANFAGVFCPPDVRRQRSTKPCLYIDYRRLINNPKSDNFSIQNAIGEVTLTAIDVGVTWERWRLIDVGLGTGVMRFHTSRKDTTVRTLVLPRIQLKPLLLFADQDFWYGSNNPKLRRQWASVLKLYVKHSVILGRLQGSDFGADNSSFDVTNDRVTSAGILLDFSELIRH